MKRILYYLGTGLEILGALLVVPTMVAYYYGEPTFPFFISCIISLILGLLIIHNTKREHLPMSEALVFGAIIFLVMAAVGAIPYYLSETFLGTPLDAYFESMSGFTTTGLTLITNLGEQPRSLLFWRAFTQWIGGIGIVVMFLSILMQPGMSAFYLYKAEGKEERIWPSILRTVQTQFKIYVLFTIIGAALLILIGIPIFQSISHVLTSLSTGGFSTSKMSIISLETFGRPWFVDIVVVILMIAGSTSFALHNKLLHGQVKDYFKNTEVHHFYFFLFLGFLILLLDQLKNGDASFFRHAIFQAVSALTTTGYTNMDFSFLSDIGKYTLIILMIFGGSSGSTSGGIKMIRLAILFRAIPWYLKKLMLPQDAVVPFKIGKTELNPQQALLVSIYAMTYIFILFFGTFVIMLDGFTLMESLFESTSALGTVGLSLGITTSLSISSKVIVILQMLLGRLEIIPIFAVLMMFTKTGRYL